MAAAVSTARTAATNMPGHRTSVNFAAPGPTARAAYTARPGTTATVMAISADDAAQVRRGRGAFIARAKCMKSSRRVR
jgi:hypothetical protein